MAELNLFEKVAERLEGFDIKTHPMAFLNEAYHLGREEGRQSAYKSIYYDLKTSIVHWFGKEKFQEMVEEYKEE